MQEDEYKNRLYYWAVVFRSGKCAPNPIAPKFHPSCYRCTEEEIDKIIEWYIINENGNKYENHYKYDTVEAMNADDPYLVKPE